MPPPLPMAMAVSSPLSPPQHTATVDAPRILRGARARAQLCVGVEASGGRRGPSAMQRMSPMRTGPAPHLRGASLRPPVRVVIVAAASEAPKTSDAAAAAATASASSSDEVSKTDAAATGNGETGTADTATARDAAPAPAASPTSGPPRALFQIALTGAMALWTGFALLHKPGTPPPGP